MNIGHAVASTGRARSLPAVLVFLLAQAAAVAATYTWKGTNSTAWTDNGNWLAGVAGPTGGASVNRLDVNNGTNNPLVYDASLGTTIYSNSGAGARGLVIGSGTGGSGTMIITGGTFSTAGSTAPDVFGNSGNTGTLIVDGGNYISGTPGLSLGLNGSIGNLVINNGSATITLLDLQASPATVSLNGGILTARKIQRTNVSTTAIFNFNGGTLKPGMSTNSWMSGLNRANVRNNGAVIDTAGFDVTISQPLLHSNIGGDNDVDGGLAKSGVGSLTLTGANTFNGDTVISGGTLILGNALALQNSPLNYNSQGGTLSFDVLTSATLGGLKGAQNLPSSSLTSLTLNPGAGVVVDYSGDLGDGGGTLALVKSGAGTQILSGPGTHAGLTTVAAGYLQAGHNGALGAPTGSNLVSNGGALVLANGITISGETVTINGYGPNVRGALQAASGATAEWAGPVLIGVQGDTRVGAQANGVLRISGDISDGGGTTFIVSADAATGKVILSGATKTYSGQSQIIRGTLELGADDVLPVTSVLNVHSASGVADGAILEMNGYDQRVGGLRYGSTSGSATIRNSSAGPSALTVDNTDTSSFSGAIEGNLALVKSGPGILSLSGANTFSGGVTLNDGVLRVNSDTALGGSAGAFVINGGTVGNTSGSPRTLANNHPVTINGDFIADLTANSLNLGSGAVSLGTAAGSTRTLTVNGYTLTVGGDIADGTTANGIVKAGSGTLALAGNSTLSGSINVTDGLLIVNGTANSVSSVGVSGTGRLGGGGSLGGAATITTVDGTVAPGNSIGTLSLGGAVTLNGTYDAETDAAGNADLLSIASGGSLSLAGTSALNLLNALTLGNTYVIARYPTAGLAGTFGSHNVPAEWQIQYNQSGGSTPAGFNEIWLVEVPEPSALGLLVVAGLVGAGRRRRVRAA